MHFIWWRDMLESSTVVIFLVTEYGEMVFQMIPTQYTLSVLPLWPGEGGWRGRATEGTKPACTPPSRSAPDQVHWLTHTLSAPKGNSYGRANTFRLIFIATRAIETKLLATSMTITSVAKKNQKNKLTIRWPGNLKSRSGLY